MSFLALAVSLAACGGTPELTCDEGSYKSAVRAPRVQAPEDLDNLEPAREMPLPTASPRDPRPEGSPCIELPPTVIGS
jgi:hypothetical protein